MENNLSGKVLIIDDSKRNLKLMTSLLEPEGYTVLQALNGNMGLTVAKNAMPDLVLLDIRMPDMDGYETCKSFKSDPGWREFPSSF